MVTSNTELGYNSKVEGGVVVSRADAVINWIRTNSMWPMPMGLACCAIELMAVGGARFDIARFGAEVMRFSPRQSDCMIVAGSVNSPDRIRALRVAGADAFTIGSAAFDGSFAPRKGLLRSQLVTILDACRE